MQHESLSSSFSLLEIEDNWVWNLPLASFSISLNNLRFSSMWNPELHALLLVRLQTWFLLNLAVSFACLVVLTLTLLSTLLMALCLFSAVLLSSSYLNVSLKAQFSYNIWSHPDYSLTLNSSFPLVYTLIAMPLLMAFLLLGVPIAFPLPFSLADSYFRVQLICHLPWSVPLVFLISLNFVVLP